MTRPLVSVIVPAFNAERTLSRAFNSVLQQHYPHWELTIVNDGSSDGTGNVSESIAKVDPRVRVVHQKNLGLSAARNRGLQESSGELIQFLDADDELLPEKLAVQVEILEPRSAVDLVICDAEIVRSDSTLKSPYQFPDKNFATELWERNFIVVNSPLIRRQMINLTGAFHHEPAGGYEVYGCEDWEFWLRMFQLGAKCQITRKVLVRNHQDGSTMSEDKLKMALSELWALHSAFNHLSESPTSLKKIFEHSVIYRAWRIIGSSAPQDIAKIRAYLADDPVLNLHGFQDTYLRILAAINTQPLLLPARLRSKFFHFKLRHAIRRQKRI